MSLDKHFCSSPWLHMRINNQGQYEFCRWANRDAVPYNNESPVVFFKKNMAEVRLAMLSGNPVEHCYPCYEMELHNKVGGRPKQLLKTGIRTDCFEKTLLSSPWLNEFKYSAENNGDTNLLPVDWQIDLGNHCNSACVFCTPQSSSRLAQEFKSIGLIQELPDTSWFNDQAKFKEITDLLIKTKKLRYIHFIGGETLITPAFKSILKVLVDSGLTGVTLGFTTNLTVWPEDVVDLLKQFKEINVGLSIESMSRLNDYVRWPSKIENVKVLLDRWVRLAHEKSWLVQIRVTPTALTVKDLINVYKYAWQHNLNVEACNFIKNPSFFSPSVLPKEYRLAIIEDLQQWASSVNFEQDTSVVNVRAPDMVKQQLMIDLHSYVSFLKTDQNFDAEAKKLANYLKVLDTNRGNCVLDYLPEYEEFFRSAGY